MKHLLILILISFCGSTSFSQQSADKAEVLVFGTKHLRSHNMGNDPLALNLVNAALIKFNPDLIVLEWLHPSINRDSLWNYRWPVPPDLLSRLWRYEDMEAIDIAFETYVKTIQELKINQLPTAYLRKELGKLYYLKGDELNAGYQWWLAQNEGADISDLLTLSSYLFKNHEIREFGFVLGKKAGLEYLSPFDYQGEDTGWRIWGEMLNEMETLSIKKRYGLTPESQDYEDRANEYNHLRKQFENHESDAWVSQYGDIKEVGEYIQVINSFKEYDRFGFNGDPTGLQMFIAMQGKEYNELERHIQYDMIPSLTLNDAGQRRLEGNKIRNERMADFMEDDIEKLGARKILVIVGFQHKHFLEDILRKRGYKIVPSGDYMPQINQQP